MLFDVVSQPLGAADITIGAPPFDRPTSGYGGRDVEDQRHLLIREEDIKSGARWRWSAMCSLGERWSGISTMASYAAHRWKITDSA